MAAKRTFEIAFVGLKQGVHEFNYVVDDKFFVEKGEPDFTNCQANIKLLLDKKSSFLQMKFEMCVILLVIENKLQFHQVSFQVDHR